MDFGNNEAIQQLFEERFGEWKQSGYLHPEVLKRIATALLDAYLVGIEEAEDSRENSEENW
jgi:hypothetical protein